MYESTVFHHRDIWGKGDAKWSPSIRCMCDFFLRYGGWGRLPMFAENVTSNRSPNHHCFSPATPKEGAISLLKGSASGGIAILDGVWTTIGLVQGASHEIVAPISLLWPASSNLIGVGRGLEALECKAKTTTEHPNTLTTEFDIVPRCSADFVLHFPSYSQELVLQKDKNN